MIKMNKSKRRKLYYYVTQRRTVIDLDRVYRLPMIKKVFDKKYKTIKLGDVSKAVLNVGKYKDFDGLTIQTQSSDDQKRYVLRDAQLVAELVRAKEGEIIGSMKAVSELVGLPLHKVCNSSLMRWWEHYNETIDFPPSDRAKDQVTGDIRPKYYWDVAGGYIIDPKPGIYDNVAMIDLQSEYPKMIEKYNISPDTINCACHMHDPAAQVPAEVLVDRRGYPLSRKYWIHPASEGVGKLAQAITNFKRERINAKLAGNTTRAEALKILINGAYGLYNNPAFAQADSRVEELVTAYARHTIKKMIDIAERELDLPVIYTHTDSVFIPGSDKRLVQTFVDKCEMDLETEIGKPIKFCDRLIISKINHYIAYYHNDPEPEVKGMEGKKSDRFEWINITFAEFVKRLRFDMKDALTYLQMQISDLEAKKITNPRLLQIEIKLDRNPENYKSNIVQKRLGLYLGKSAGDTIRFFKVSKKAEKEQGVKALLDPNNIDMDKVKEELVTVFGPVLYCLNESKDKAATTSTPLPLTYYDLMTSGTITLSYIEQQYRKREDKKKQNKKKTK